MTRLSHHIEVNASLRHLDANIELENFFRDLLNMLRGSSLQNANWAGRANHDSFDLEDRQQRIAVQVTSTMTAAKIKNTLKTFIPAHRDHFDRLLFVYPRLSKPASTADFSPLLLDFDFDAQRDRQDLSDLLREMQNQDIGKQQQVLHLLRGELKPLGRALQLGVDQNVEAIISIIQYISDGLPNTRPEPRPDAIRKLARFQEYADFLKRQHTTFFSTIAQLKRPVKQSVTMRCVQYGAQLGCKSGASRL